MYPLGSGIPIPTFSVGTLKISIHPQGFGLGLLSPLAIKMIERTVVSPMNNITFF